MSFTSFHPIVQQWFTAEVGVPTAAQQRGWASIREDRHTLIAAPTGSGKTLAAFLSALDQLFQDGLRGELRDEVRVLYVSPLKALSADIHTNLSLPRSAIHRRAAAAGLPVPQITAAVRTGDTTQSERAAMLRTPPHLLVTTPESLYLLLTADRSREMLRSATTVIVDEIHAVIGTRRGAHLALSLERLRTLTGRPVQRIGLSATQKPMADVARFLVGTCGGDCTVIDAGHRREMDLGVEIPRSSLDAVMSQEVWEEYYDRLQALIEAHRTTLIFVNTRRMAERLARHLSDRLGEEAVTAHHGSLSKETRLDAEGRLKAGTLRALVATASLELGIDVGHVDLVCQIGSPHRIATFLQRAGRSGHTISGTPNARLFPVSREDLVECAALLRAVRQGELDAIVQHDAPLDVLAQQLVAESTCGSAVEDELFEMTTRAWPYRALARQQFDSVVKMAAEGFSTRRGRRAALLHRDEINGRVRGRRGARLLAQMSGGAIPEVADYRVVLEPGDTFIGTVNEDFAIESMVGDVFQLGNSAWRVLQVAGGTVRVADAHGAQPNIPFWFGEAPARSDELSRVVSALRAEADARLAAGGPAEAGPCRSESVGAGFSRPINNVVDWLIEETGIPRGAAEQLADYFAEGRRLLGVIPTQQTLVLERFFDESGGMQLVLHAPFGSRINKAWGLALRKRFCRQFNFELQAAATEDAVLLSLGPQHSFPLADVFRYLHPESTRDVLVQAFLDAPVFQTRWRWNTTISLAVPRNRGGRKLAPQIQRMLADDLMASVFPDAAACLENIPGDREIPDHPLVSQTIQDCLQEAMDFDGLTAVLRRIHAGELRLVARDTPEPSVFAHEILNARPYAFLDDAPLEERRAHAVQSRRAGEPSSSGDLGALDAAAIDRVRDEARPDPRDADELHDALMTVGFLTVSELERRHSGNAEETGHRGNTEETRFSAAFVASLLREGRATFAGSLLVAAERTPEIAAIRPDASFDPPVQAPPSRTIRAWSRVEAIAEILRGRLTIEGPARVTDLASKLGLESTEVEAAMLELEGEGVVLRGRFTPGAAVTEWCDRALLSRIHRYTLGRLRAEIEPVSAADYMRFLFRWQHVHGGSRLTGLGGLREIVMQLDGFELAAAAWERSVLPVRLDAYDPSMLDMLCLAGEVGWARLSAPAVLPGNTPRLVPATPIALFLRENSDQWRRIRDAQSVPDVFLTQDARQLLDVLNRRGACFFAELRSATGFDDDRIRSGIGVLVACGMAVSDGFSGLRALVWAARGHRVTTDRRATFAGRWTAVAPAATDPVAPGFSRKEHEDAIDLFARTLLRRYGVVFRRVIAREANAPPWRDLCRAYRRLEARGEIRGGRFVSGMSSEQFALPEAIPMLREVRRSAPDGCLVAVSTADPLNLAGIVTPGDRIRAAARNRMVYRDGVPLAVMEGDVFRELHPIDGAIAAEVARLLARRKVVRHV